MKGVDVPAYHSRGQGTGLPDCVYAASEVHQPLRAVDVHLASFDIPLAKLKYDCQKTARSIGDADMGRLGWGSHFNGGQRNDRVHSAIVCRKRPIPNLAP